MPVLRVFLEAIRPQGEPEEKDSEAVKRMKVTLAGVRTALRDAVDPELVMAVDEDTSAVNDAIHDLLFSDPGCEALAPLHEAARRVREGSEVSFPDTPADLAVRDCVGQHGGDHCSAGQFLLALFSDCRREGRGHCLGVPLLDGGGAACQDFSRLDEAARRCLTLNGVRCHAADDLDEPKPAEGDAKNEAAEEADEDSETGAGEGEVEEGEPGEPDAEVSAAAGPAERVMAAVWDWARRYNLVADQATLRRVEAEFGEDPLLPEMAYHSSLLHVAYRTLRAWAASPEARAELSWHYPEQDNVEFDDAALCLFHGLPEHVSPGEDGTGDEFVCR
jgi:hypothetical protein